MPETKKIYGPVPPDGSYNALLRKYNALKAENENLKENLFVMSDPDYYKGLLETMKRVETGEAKFVSFTPEEFDEYNGKLSDDEN